MRILLLLWLLPFCAAAQRTEFSIATLVDFTAYPAARFEAAIHKKGFTPAFNEETTSVTPGIYNKLGRYNEIEKIVGKHESSDTTTVYFETTSSQEWAALKMQMKEAGFAYPEADADTRNGALYQKGNITAQPYIANKNGREIFCLKVCRKQLPKAGDITYAEDLLKLTSHEYIAAVFGERYVKKDLFYFSEKEVNKCSIMFPGTNMQVIFVWKDEANNKDISFLIIGGDTRANNSPAFYAQNEFYKWRSANGVFLGMSLNELAQLNEAPITLWGWDTDQPGAVSSCNGGKLNLKKLGIQLNCLDCSDDAVYTKNNYIQSTVLQKEGRRAVVSSLILLPQKN